MSRGGFRFHLVGWSVVALSQVAALIVRFAWGSVWGVRDYLSLTMVILAGTFIGYLFHVRRHDGHFWDEEEAVRAEWERRGRAL